MNVTPAGCEAPTASVAFASLNVMVSVSVGEFRFVSAIVTPAKGSVVEPTKMSVVDPPVIVGGAATRSAVSVAVVGAGV